MPHKLLLADDSITIQRVIELTFAEEDVQVLAVGDGKLAIDRIQADLPDIVLADVGMPEQDGYQVAAFIKSNPHLSHIPVLLLTGAFEPIDESRARAVGCDGVLVKPFEPQMVINRVKDLLAGRRSGAPGNSSSSQPAGEPAAGHEARPSSDLGAGAPKQPGDSLEDYFDRLDAAFATLGADPAPVPAQSPSATVPAPQSAVVASSQPATAEDFASWDPDLAGDAGRPAAYEPFVGAPAAVVAPPPITQVPPVSVHVSVTAPAPPPVAPVAMTGPAAAPQSPAPIAPASPQISLAEAFAALLAAEHGQAIAPAASPRSIRGPLSPGDTPAPAPDVVHDVHDVHAVHAVHAVDDIVRRVLDRLQDQDMRQTVVDVAERLVREEIDRIKRATGTGH